MLIYIMCWLSLPFPILRRKSPTRTISKGMQLQCGCPRQKVELAAWNLHRMLSLKPFLIGMLEDRTYYAGEEAETYGAGMKHCLFLWLFLQIYIGSPCTKSLTAWHKNIKWTLLFSSITIFYIIFPFKHGLLHSCLSGVSRIPKCFMLTKPLYYVCQVHRASVTCALRSLVFSLSNFLCCNLGRRWGNSIKLLFKF